MAFVGREVVLHTLDEALDEALAGRGRLLMVTGEAGMGKTALLLRFAERARARDVAVVVGRCLETAGRPAYQPWLDVQRDLVGRGWLTEDATPIPVSAQSSRAALIDDVVAALKATSDVHDVVVIVEDLHLANRETALLLQVLAGRLHESRLLVVASCRRGEASLARDISDVVDELAADEITLAPLGEEDIRVLLAAAGLPGDRSAPVLGRTGGNPLFVSTAIRLLRSGATDVDAAEIPPGIRQAVRRQIRLAAEAHSDVPELLEAASVVGERFGVAVARYVYPRDNLLDAVDAAVTAGLLAEQAGSVAEFAFTHALVRDTVYSDIPPGRRAALHARVLDAGDLVDPDDAAFHAVRAASAGKASVAVELSVQAAARASELYAYEAAATHLRHALAAGELVAPHDSAQVCDLLTALATACGHAGDLEAARAQGLRAADLAARIGDVPRRARALLAAAEHVPFLDRDDELAELLRACAADLGDEATPERALLLARLASLGSDDAATRERLTAEAVDVARRLGVDGLLFDVLATRMQALWGSPAHRHGPADARDLLSAAGTAERKVQAHLWVLYHDLTACDIPAARIQVSELERMATRTSWGRHHLYATSRRAMLDTLTGDFASARAALESAYEIGLTSRDPEADAVRWGQLYTLAWHVDVSPADVEFLRSAADRYLGTSTHRLFRLAQAVLALRGGNRDAAAEMLATATTGGVESLPKDMHLPWLLALTAWLCAHLGEPVLARDVDAALAPYDGRAIVVAGAVQWMGTVSHYRGLAAHAQGDPVAASDRLEAARQTYERIGARPWAVHAMRDLATVTGRANPRAEELAARLGMRAEARGPTLSREGEVWRLTGGTTDLLFKDSLGLGYLARLIGSPGRQISATALAGLPESSADSEVLDRQAVAAYRGRIAELRRSIDEADEDHDLERAARERSELEFLIAELERAAGLGGRSRRLGSQGERARINVTRAIHSALDRVHAQDPDLAQLLRNCVQTGNLCSYTPRPQGDFDGESSPVNRSTRNQRHSE